MKLWTVSHCLLKMPIFRWNLIHWQTATITSTFTTDLNANGVYDAPPAAHAWRITLNIVSDTTIGFVHIEIYGYFPRVLQQQSSWYKLTVDFSSMTPHIGQELILYLRDPGTGDFIDSVIIDPVDAAEFSVVFDSVAVDVDYNLDFYADLNGNGRYDVPPADHAWRIELTQILDDTTIAFVHNTTFTDIGLAITGIDDKDGEAGFETYPNPVKNELTVQISRPGTGLSIYNVAGGLILHKSLTSSDKQVKVDVSSLKPGMYILRLDRDSGSSQRKFLKE